MTVANSKLNLLICSIFITTLILSGCNAQKPIINPEIDNRKMVVVNSECQFKTVFDDSIPARVSYFKYEGNSIKFESNPESYWQSVIVKCMVTDEGLIIIGQNRSHPAESIARMSLSTYLYNGRNFILKKNLNRAWSCMPDHSKSPYFDLLNMTINIKCKDNKEGNENITSSFDKQFVVNIL